MQTFLPYESFEQSMAVLDRKRLGKQRVEAYQILRAISDPDYGWQHHPAVNMWRGYDQALVRYTIAACLEWHQRGYDDSIIYRAFGMMNDDPVVLPPWLGNEDFHLSHRSNLIRKDPAHYAPLFPEVPSNLPYVWPTKEGVA